MLVARPHQDSAGTTAVSSRWSSPSPSRPRGFSTATSVRDARSRTARSSAAIGSIRRSSGSGSASRSLRRQRPRCPPGSITTTTNDSPSRSRAARRPRNSRGFRSRRPCSRDMRSTVVRHRGTEVNLDETQQRPTRPLTALVCLATIPPNRGAWVAGFCGALCVHCVMGSWRRKRSRASP